VFSFLKKQYGKILYLNSVEPNIRFGVLRPGAVVCFCVPQHFFTRRTWGRSLGLPCLISFFFNTPYKTKQHLIILVSGGFFTRRPAQPQLGPFPHHHDFEPGSSQSESVGNSQSSQLFECLVMPLISALFAIFRC